MSFIVDQKEREEFRWRAGIGWSGNRQSMRMYTFGHGVDKACMNKKLLKYVCE